MLKAIEERFSVRDYNDKTINEEDLNEIVKAIQLAPTWKNKQCFEVVVMDDRKLIKELGEIVAHNPSQSAYDKASHIFVFVADPTRSGLRDGKPYYLADTAIAMEHAVLQASELGIGSCWICVFPEEEVKAHLNIPDELRVVGFLSLGYANEQYKQRPRRELNEFIHKNTYK